MDVGKEAKVCSTFDGSVQFSFMELIEIKSNPLKAKLHFVFEGKKLKNSPTKLANLAFRFIRYWTEKSLPSNLT